MSPAPPPPAAGSRGRRRPWRLGALAGLVWLAVALVFAAAGVDWIALPDPGVYWEASRDLLAFNPEVPPGYPLTWRVLTDLLPDVPPAVLGQAVSFASYVAMVIVAFEVMDGLGLRQGWLATGLLALYPFIGVTASVMPRVNALLRLVTLVALLGYVRRRSWLLVGALALLPLMHRSAWPLVAALTAAGLLERRLSPWALVPIGLPLLAYWAAGAEVRHEALWMLSWKDAQPVVLGLPVADGLIGTLILGLRGSGPALVKGLGLTLYWLTAGALCWRAVRRSEPLMAALSVPAVVFGLTLPVVEIWSTLNYTTFLAIPLMAALQQARGDWLERQAVGAGVLGACLLSQFVWAWYMLRSWGL